MWKIYPVELQDRARLHFPYTYYHVECELQKRLKRQDHPLLIVSISIYNIMVFPDHTHLLFLLKEVINAGLNHSSR